MKGPILLTCGCSTHLLQEALDAAIFENNAQRTGALIDVLRSRPRHCRESGRKVLACGCSTCVLQATLPATLDEKDFDNAVAIFDFLMAHVPPPPGQEQAVANVRAGIDRRRAAHEGRR